VHERSILSPVTCFFIICSTGVTLLAFVCLSDGVFAYSWLGLDLGSSPLQIAVINLYSVKALSATQT
jgi:hypothetical protein